MHESKVCKRVYDDESASEECDHKWQVIDDSISHELGTKIDIFERCELCDKEREYEPIFGDEVL